MERVQEVEPEQPATAEPAGRLVAAPDPSGFLAWASGVGNHAAAAYVARTAADGSHGSPGVPESDFDPRAASDEERVAELRRRLAEGGSLRAVWRSFADVRATANANAELWKASVARDPGLAEDEEVLGAFRREVETLALQHLSANRDLVAQEIEELGVEQEDHSQRDEEHLAAVKKLQELADKLNLALQLKLVLLQIPVGFHEDPDRKYDAADPQGRHGESRPALFEPGKPPRNRSSGGPGFQPYEAVAPQYAKVEEALARGMAHPALFGIVEQAGGPADKDAHAALRDFAATDPQFAQASADRALHELVRGIETTSRQIGGSIDFRDVRPVHDQVLATPPFTGAYERSIAETAIQGHDTMKTLLAFGLAAVQVIAVLSTPVLGPAALIPIVGAGTAQTAMSYTEYQRLKAARAARTGAQGNDVVSEDTVDAARLQAILDGVFAFVDGIEGFAAVAKAAKLGAKAGATAAREVAEDLPRLASLEPARRDEVLGQAMATMGPGPAIDGAGGIEAVRSAAAGTPAAARAEGFVGGLEEGLAHHLADAESAQRASEPLLPRASTYVAAQAQVPETRALPALLPKRATEERLQELVARAAAQLAPEWAGKTPAAREALVQVSIRDQAKALGIPVPWLRPDPRAPLGGAAFFDDTWAVAFHPDTFTNEALTVHGLSEIFASVRHEVQHAMQFVESGRYAYYHAGDAAYLTRFPPDIQQQIITRGPLAQGSPELSKARTWYDEFGPGAATSQVVRRKMDAAITALETARARLEPATQQWRATFDRVTQAATEAEEDAAAAEMLLAYRRYTVEGPAFDAQAVEYRKVYDEYFKLATEADAQAAEQAFRAETHQRWAAEANKEIDRDMRALYAKGVLLLVGGAAAGGGAVYASYELAPKHKRPGPR